MSRNFKKSLYLVFVACLSVSTNIQAESKVNPMLEWYRTADVNAQNVIGHTPLIVAIQLKDEQWALALIDKGAELETMDGYGCTALWYASMGGLESVVKKLLERGANPNTYRYPRGYTALHIAAEKGHSATIKMLLEAGAAKDIHPFDINPELNSPEFGLSLSDLLATPYDVAMKNGHSDAAKLLSYERWYRQAKPNEVNPRSGRTPLLDAISWMDEDAACALIERGDDYNARDPYMKINALCQASRMGLERVVMKLIEKGCDVHAKSPRGYTALYYADLGHQEKIKQILLNAKQKNNDTTEDLD